MLRINTILNTRLKRSWLLRGFFAGKLQKLLAILQRRCNMSRFLLKVSIGIAACLVNAYAQADTVTSTIVDPSTQEKVTTSVNPNTNETTITQTNPATQETTITQTNPNTQETTITKTNPATNEIKTTKTNALTQETTTTIVTPVPAPQQVVPNPAGYSHCFTVAAGWYKNAWAAEHTVCQYDPSANTEGVAWIAGHWTCTKYKASIGACTKWEWRAGRWVKTFDVF